MGKNKSNNTKTVFIIGQSRSGTTLLRSVLNNHPCVSASPELYEFERLWGRRNILSKVEAAEIISRKFNIKEKDKERLKKTDSWPDFLSVLMRITAYKEDYDIFVCKTPMNIYFVDVILNNFPGSVIIFIVRDGREVCASAVKRWKKEGLLPLSMAARWVLTMRAYEKKLKQHPHYIIKYEEITKSTDNSLSNLFSYVGLSYDSDYSHSVGSTSSFSDVKKAGIYQSKHFKMFFNTKERMYVEGLLKPFLHHLGYSLEFDEHTVPLRIRIMFYYYYCKHFIYFALTRLGLRDVWRAYRKVLRLFNIRCI